jgi:hypothetical protein
MAIPRSVDWRGFDDHRLRNTADGVDIQSPAALSGVVLSLDADGDARHVQSAVPRNRHTLMAIPLGFGHRLRSA